MNTVLFVNATIGFSENLFLVPTYTSTCGYRQHCAMPSMSIMVKLANNYFRCKLVILTCFMVFITLTIILNKRLLTAYL